MRLEVGPAEVHIVPGTSASVVAQIFNADDVINAYEIRVFGVDPEWVELERERLSLFPSSAGVVAIGVRVPEGYPAGTLRLGVEVTPVVDDSLRQLGEVSVVVPPRRIATVTTDPAALAAGRRGTFNLTFANDGNTPFELTLASTDPEAKVKTRFEPPTIEIVPGEQATVTARTSARPPLLGAPTARLVTFSAKGADHPLESMVSFVQRPVFGRGLISMFGLLVAVSVFAVVLTSTLGRVVDASKVPEALIKRAIEGVPDDRGIPDDPGSVTGRVALLTSGAGVSGVTVELFAADDPAKPVATAASSDDGSYTIGNLNEGTYKLRFRGAGFVELWFEDALTFEDATEIDVALGEETPDLDMAIGGLPGSIAGVVIADDPASVTVTLQVPAAVLGSAADAQIKEVATDAAGAFLLEDVPAPSSYELVVSKPGFTTVTRVVNLLAGEAQEGVEVRLRRGDGLIGGLITDVDGVALGGVAISATNTVEELSTISLTTGEVGGFNLRNLPTPATYTLTFTKDGYATENLTLTLEEAEEVIGLSIVLAEGTGSISGEVRVAGEGPIGGVTVSVSDGETTVTTETLSVGFVGSYLVTGLRVPALYTVTFAGPGLASQVRSVDLDPSDDINAEGINATLTAATATVTGTVEDPDGPAAGVAVELSDGTTILTTTTANDPVGEYVLAGVPPGTYTLTFRQTGAVPRSVLVTVTAGQHRTVDVELDPQASISGTVESDDGAPLNGVQVLVYKVAEFPGTVAAETFTDANGDYTVTDLDAPEEYILEFAYPEGAIPGDSVRVTLDAGEALVNVDAEIELVGAGG